MARSSNIRCATRSAANGNAARRRSTSTCPARFGAFYIGADSEKKTPVMMHRAMFGSLERFTGILIEHYAGHLPLWLSPTADRRLHDHPGRRRLRPRNRRGGAKARAFRRHRPAQREDLLQGARTFARQDSRAAVAGKKEAAERTGVDPPAGLAGADVRPSSTRRWRRWRMRRRRPICGDSFNRKGLRRELIPSPLRDGGPGGAGRVEAPLPVRRFPIRRASRPPAPGRRSRRFSDTRGAATQKPRRKATGPNVRTAAKL